MVNHLASGSASANRAQANALNLWAEEQELPVINVGDFNFRLNLSSGSVRPGYDIMRNGPWFELEPIFRARTQANFNSILDHVFIANRDAAVGWSGEARILNRIGDRRQLPTSAMAEANPITGRLTQFSHSIPST